MILLGSSLEVFCTESVLRSRGLTVCVCDGCDVHGGDYGVCFVYDVLGDVCGVCVPPSCILLVTIVQVVGLCKLLQNVCLALWQVLFFYDSAAVLTHCGFLLFGCLWSVERRPPGLALLLLLAFG